MINMKKFSLIGLGILTTALLVSCSKTPQQKISKAQSVSGTYLGILAGTTFKSSGNNNASGMADVSPVNDSTVSIHCYDDSTGFDTTFMMGLYQNGSDSIMLCSTGQDFYNQYGFSMDSMMSANMGGSMMGGSMMGGTFDGNEWQQLMYELHNPGNGHYGSFNMMDSTFYYPFTQGDRAGADTVYMTFNGRKH